MKLASMIALAVKRTFNERIETFVELGKFGKKKGTRIVFMMLCAPAIPLDIRNC